ncbi:MAG TPA: DUF159 family protein [Erwinia sp.]|uniref:SOS response-associated peptidase family protein n=1 Tax=Erwinia citreus TaxID=558 RepID=UPI000E952E6A|nr:SOS response-associated peptidase family protein [Erwinia sp.]HBV40403.1 DUF159 family protein [Erwinia sp.]
MCGRFTQYQSREAYLEAFNTTLARDIAYDPEPLGRYNVAPGTRVLLLNERDATLHLDPVHWGYRPAWWHKQPLINAKSETAATGKMFKPLWHSGRAIVMADGWYEWKRDGSNKQPYFIYHQRSEPLFFAAIGKAPYDKEDEGFAIVTAASDKGLLDIHDRRPLVLTPEAALAWMSGKTTAEQASGIAKEGAVPIDEFAWHPVSKAVGNIKNQRADLIEEVEPA